MISWQDFSIEGLGTPAVDGIGEESFGTMWGTGAPYSGDLVLPGNLSSYTAFTMEELVRRVFRRKDLFLSERMLSVGFPLTASFADTVGAENIKPLNICIPVVPTSARKRVTLDVADEPVAAYSAVDIAVWTDRPMAIGVELLFSDATSASIQAQTPTAEEWKVLRYAIPAGHRTKHIRFVKFGPDVAPRGTAALLQIGRVSLKCIPQLIPAPVG